MLVAEVVEVVNEQNGIVRLMRVDENEEMEDDIIIMFCSKTKLRNFFRLLV